MTANRSAVLCFSGHDPTGGAGIQADIEACASQGCHAVSVITALTRQDTRNVVELIPQKPEDIVNQATTLLADIPITAIKIGLLGHAGSAEAVAEVIGQYPNLPVVLDPVLASGGGARLADNKLVKAIVHLLLPLTTLLTPNSQEARQLVGLSDLSECGLRLLAMGCRYVLITGTHEESPEVTNWLFHQGECVADYNWERLPHTYHGSGCTLAASIAALLARGETVPEAIAQAQAFTWQSLSAGFRPGQGQHIPNRCFEREVK